MKEIELRGLNNPLLYVTDGVMVEMSSLENDEEDEEDCSFTQTETYAIFQDEINNNIIVYSYYSLNEEETPEDIVASISNSIRNSAFDYLINVLNNSKNTVVYWSQVEGTTSDYIIYYDIEIPELIDYNSIYNLTIDLSTDEILGYKYTEVKNGNVLKLKFERRVKVMAKIETSLKDTKELRQLIIDNPNLPLLIFAGEDSWHDNWCYEMNYAHGIGIEDLTNYKDLYVTKEDFEDTLIDDLSYDDEYKNLSDDDFDKMVDDIVAKAEFTKCIVVYVG